VYIAFVLSEGMLLLLLLLPAWLLNAAAIHWRPTHRREHQASEGAERVGSRMSPAFALSGPLRAKRSLQLLC